jgi:hypothetical protein
MKTLRDYQPVLSRLMNFMAHETRFRCRPGLGSILSQNPQMVVAISHGSPLSWLPAASLLTAHACARGGSARRPMGVMDRFFFHVPGLKRIAHALTQAERPLNLFELAECVDSGDYTDIIVFPEGSNCFFGRPDTLQDFRSPRFIEIAVQHDLPILICVHRGSETWAKAIEVNPEVINQLDLLPKFIFDFFETRLRRTGIFTLPLWPSPMKKFEMLCELYQPELTKNDLSQDEMERRTQVRQEAQKVHDRMQSMLKELDDSSDLPSNVEAITQSYRDQNMEQKLDTI